MFLNPTPPTVIPGLDPGTHLSDRASGCMGPRIKSEDDGRWGHIVLGSPQLTRHRGDDTEFV